MSFIKKEASFLITEFKKTSKSVPIGSMAFASGLFLTAMGNPFFGLLVMGSSLYMLKARHDAKTKQNRRNKYTDGLPDYISTPAKKEDVPPPVEKAAAAQPPQTMKKPI